MIKVGLHGCGRVGKALLKILNKKENIEVLFIKTSKTALKDRDGLSEDILSAVINEDLKGDEDQDLLSLIKETQIHYLFELTPTNLEEKEAVHSLLQEVLDLGVSVITANKAPILHDYVSLANKAREKKVGLGLSGVMGASLPSYALAHYGTLGSKVVEIKGILNGTSNYILSRMEDGHPFVEVMEEAIDQGIAEPNYAYDVDGFDAAVKMSIIASVIEHKNISFNREDVSGIRSLSYEDFKEAEERDTRLKLVASYRDGRVHVRVENISWDDPYYFVSGAEKILTLRTEGLGEMSVLGGASGLEPVAYSLLRDLYTIEEQKQNHGNGDSSLGM